MRKLAVFAAMLGMVAGPIGSAQAQDYHEQGDIYSHNGGGGASFARSTQCAAIFSLATGAVPEGTDDYRSMVKNGTAWLFWAQWIAQGRDAEGEMNNKIAAFNQKVSGKSPEGATDELAKEIRNCVTIKNTMSSTDPFATIFGDAFNGTTNGADLVRPAAVASQSSGGRPDIYTALDCMANTRIVAAILGEQDEAYALLQSTETGWGNYAKTLESDMDKLAELAGQRGGDLGDGYDKMNRDDAIAKIQQDMHTCESLQSSISEFF